MPKEKKFKYMEEEPKEKEFITTTRAETDKVCKLILECMDLNRVNKSAAVSAMATLMVSIYLQLDSRSPFDLMMNTCQKFFDQEWAFKMESNGKDSNSK